MSNTNADHDPSTADPAGSPNSTRVEDADLEARISRIVDQRLAERSDTGSRDEAAVPASPAVGVDEHDARADDEAVDRAVRRTHDDPVAERRREDARGDQEDTTATDTDRATEPTAASRQAGSDGQVATDQPTPTTPTDSWSHAMEAHPAHDDDGAHGDRPAHQDRPDDHDRADHGDGVVAEERRDATTATGVVTADDAVTGTSATLALVFGLGAVIAALAPAFTPLAVLLGLLSLLLGIVGLVSTRKPNVTGRALAVIGLLLGLLGAGVGAAAIAGYPIDGVNDQSTADDLQRNGQDIRDQIIEDLGL
ncbi:hypothetical protein [Euzebya tangerina]|uniref:hypothetical protein n=1 Tax=Euzebya tangerina TaxID=591198 RepID=UPI000E313232|nr:hypothetical protein [Euzebya tangerina]